MTTIEITSELRNEIIAAVEASGVSSPESVCDWVIDAAANGKEWRAELARAVAADHPDGCSCGSPNCPQWLAAQERI